MTRQEFIILFLIIVTVVCQFSTEVVAVISSITTISILLIVGLLGLNNKIYKWLTKPIFKK